VAVRMPSASNFIDEEDSEQMDILLPRLL